MSNRNDALTYLGVALVAGAVGAAVGMLLAPAAGRETRRRLADGLQDAGGAVRNRLHRAGKDASHCIEGAVECVEGAVEAGVRKISTAARV